MEWDILDRDAFPFVALKVSALADVRTLVDVFLFLRIDFLRFISLMPCHLMSSPVISSQSRNPFVGLSMSFMHFEVDHACRRVTKCPPKRGGLVRVLSIADCDDTMTR